MTLSTETVALLRYGIDALLHLTGPASYALLTPDERKTALQHLIVTAEAAATFAEVAQREALALPNSSSSDTEHIMEEGNRQEVQDEAGEKETEAECLGRHHDRSMLETERLRAELVQVRKEKVIIEEDTQWLRKGLERARSAEMMSRRTLWGAASQGLVGDIERFERTVGKLAVEKARVEGEEESMCKAIESLVQETERLREELDRLRTETNVEGASGLEGSGR
ncbi:hypothetical protein DFP73DRAFT_567238 [Morchella snyderi]|nr:hypothetical protein DFP73DRAFT_567238 [Morchella snyderi]